MMRPLDGSVGRGMGAPVSGTRVCPHPSSKEEDLELLSCSV